MPSKYNLPEDLDISLDEDFSKDRLDRAWNYLVKRLLILDSFKPMYEEQIELLRDVGLDRLNQALQPIYDRIQTIANLGVIFSAVTSDDYTVGAGIKVFVVPESRRQQFAPAAYVSVISTSSPSNSMSGFVSSYERDTGALTVNITDIKGSGRFTEWQISAAAAPTSFNYTKSEIDGLIASLIGGATSEFNSLGELQAALASLQASVTATVQNLAPKSSPDFSGTPMTSEPLATDKSRRVPTTNWVSNAIAGAADAISKFDARTGEKHPWEIRSSESQVSYQYGTTTTLGLFDTQLGNIWSTSLSTGLTTFSRGVTIGGDVTASRIKLLSNGAGDNITVGDDAKIGDVDIENTFGIRGVQNPALGYVAFGSGNQKFGWDGSKLSFNGATIWHSGNFAPANYATATDVSGNYFNKSSTTAQQVQNLPSFNAFGIDIVRGNVFRWRSWVETNGEYQLRGGDDGGVRFSLRTDGALWTSQIGDLNTRIESRAGAYAAERVAKTGDTMSGNLSITKSYPEVVLTHPGAMSWSNQVREDGRLYWHTNSRFNVLSFGADGSIQTAQFGDLNTRIETRAREYAEDRASRISGRWVFIGDRDTNERDLWEGWGGSAITGYASSNSSGYVTRVRFRQLQLRNQNNDWYAVQYA